MRNGVLAEVYKVDPVAVHLPAEITSVRLLPTARGNFTGGNCAGRLWRHRGAGVLLIVGLMVAGSYERVLTN